MCLFWKEARDTPKIDCAIDTCRREGANGLVLCFCTSKCICLVLVHIVGLPSSCFSRRSVSIWTATLDIRIWVHSMFVSRASFSALLSISFPSAFASARLSNPRRADWRLPRTSFLSSSRPRTEYRAQSKLIPGYYWWYADGKKGGKAEMKGKRSKLDGEERRRKREERDATPSKKAKAIRGREYQTQKGQKKEVKETKGRKKQKFVHAISQ